MSAMKPLTLRELRAVVLALPDMALDCEVILRVADNDSDMAFWVCCELVRAGVSDDKIYAIIGATLLANGAHA